MFRNDEKVIQEELSSRITKVARKGEGESPSGRVHEKGEAGAKKTESQRCKRARRSAFLKFQNSNEIGRGSTVVYPAK